MGLLKRLFGKKKPPEREAFIPAPTHVIGGLEPIVVHAIENLFPESGQQMKVFQYALDYKRAYKNRIGREDLKGLLAMLAQSGGRIEDLPNPELWFFGRFRIEDIDSRFPKMKDAEEWVRSLSRPEN